MASNFTYSPILIEALTRVEFEQKLPAVVQKQSIPAGTRVKQGQTVVVTLVSPSDTTVDKVAIPNYVPPAAVSKVPISKIVEVSQAPEVDAFLKNPSDPVKREQFVATYNKSLGTNFTAGDVDQLVLLNQNFGVAR